MGFEEDVRFILSYLGGERWEKCHFLAKIKPFFHPFFLLEHDQWSKRKLFKIFENFQIT
jgi:hypothetical protein